LFQGFTSWFSNWEWLRSAVGSSIAGFVASVLLGVALYFLNRIRKFAVWLYQYFQRVRKVLLDCGREVTPIGPKEGKGIWLAEPITPPTVRGDPRILPPRILVVANAKGGVGKTTVAANLGARFAELASLGGNKPVLLIDLDFQGSLSSMSVVGRKLNGRDSNATYLISGDLSAAHILTSESATTKVNGKTISVDNLKVVTSYFDLAQAENRVMVEWLLSDRTEDVRFRLQEFLYADAIRNAFSIIIIDSPPRLTTGAIQALAAGTHLLIPTILDEPSFEAVLTFVRQVETFREKGICPNIKYVGVVGTMLDSRQNSSAMEIELRDRLKLSKELGGAGGAIDLLPRSTFIPDSVKFRDAGGKGIAYLVMGDGQGTAAVKSAIRELADIVKGRMSP
jgi:chromosome partitioning protein